MSDRLYVGTRKGLFTLERAGGRWAISNVGFLGEPVSAVLDDPRENHLFAALNLGHFGPKLHRSTDGGGSWEEIPVPSYPKGAQVAERNFDPEAPPKTKLASLSEIWCLVTGGTDEPGRIWAGTIPGGLFRSDDHGSSWELIEPLWNRDERLRWLGGGKDDPGIHSIAVHPKNSRHITLGVSCGGVWVTEDGGQSWECRGEGLRADYVPPGVAQDPNMQDVHRLAQCAADPDTLWIQHHNGIFHSTSAGRKWRELEGVRPSVFGFATAVHPHDPKTAWFVPGIKDERRIPVDGRLVVNRTKDGGETFTALDAGLPTSHCYDLVYRHGLDVDETGERLVIGSTTGGLWITENGGDRWTEISHTLPPIYCVSFAPARA
jgi:photosystem II stability/assembly factor-like uncharacterized protein